jgi:hypothetical protein
MHQTLLETNELIFFVLLGLLLPTFFKNGGTKYQTLITYITLQQALLHFLGYVLQKFVCIIHKTFQI